MNVSDRTSTLQYYYSSQQVNSNSKQMQLCAPTSLARLLHRGKPCHMWAYKHILKLWNEYCINVQDQDAKVQK